MPAPHCLHVALRLLAIIQHLLGAGKKINETYACLNATAATSICLAPDALMSSCTPRPQTFPLQVTWVLDGRSKEVEAKRSKPTVLMEVALTSCPDHPNGAPQLWASVNHLLPEP